MEDLFDFLVSVEPSNTPMKVFMNTLKFNHEEAYDIFREIIRKIYEYSEHESIILDICMNGIRHNIRCLKCNYSMQMDTEGIVGEFFALNDMKVRIQKVLHMLDDPTVTDVNKEFEKIVLEYEVQKTQPSLPESPDMQISE